MLELFFKCRRFLDPIDAAINPSPGEALSQEVGKQIAVFPLGLPNQRRKDQHPLPLGSRHDPLDDLVAWLGLKHPVAGWTMGRADPGIEHSQEVVDLGHRCHG